MTTGTTPHSIQEAWEIYCDGIKHRGEHPSEKSAFFAGFVAGMRAFNDRSN